MIQSESDSSRGQSPKKLHNSNGNAKPDILKASNRVIQLLTGDITDFALPVNHDSLRNTDGTDFSRLFYPQSIAIIGASQNKLGGSKYYFANKATGFTDYGGQIYLINPKLQELFGEPVY
ncbi:MAG TPA: hypothetical protein VKK79_20605, partial [Candidatus Lokiarchaeia archaeon]|nr:hypothetical protein [Candidatus Lokiarchaeia archaeon]